MSHYDEFDDPPRANLFQRTAARFTGRQRPGQRKPVAAMVILGVAVVVLIGILWAAYPDGESANENVPIIRADAQPFKVAPDDPGGMDIPHRDSTVFSSIRASRQEQERQIENLLAEEKQEEPVPRSQLFAGLNTEVDDSSEERQATFEDITEETQSRPQAEAQNQPQPVSERDITAKMGEESAVEIETAKSTMRTPRPDIKPEDETQAAATEPAAGAALPAGSYYVQLASVKSRDGAEGEWKKLQSKYSSQLSGFDHRVERADLGSRGIFYRIQAGPVSKEKAQQVCGEIKSMTPGGCLVTQ